MEKLFNLSKYPIQPVLSLLLADKTTKQTIVFGTRSYEHLGKRYGEAYHIKPELLLGMDAMEIQPRVLKDAAAQADRTKKKAEVMTPAWIVNKMNNHCDEEWFGYPDAFNHQEDQTWKPTRKVKFPKEKGKTWQDYVDSTRLEITCGEAPYLVSRYDTTTGEPIPIKKRIGMLDRKLRVIGENTDNIDDWFKWTVRAYQSTYGYEYQGDNLLIGRINLLLTFVEYMLDTWKEKPTDVQLKKIANIIAWNLWQMDGLTGMVPFGMGKQEFEQLTVFDYMVGENVTMEEQAIPARIFDWRSKESVTYNSLKGK